MPGALKFFMLREELRRNHAEHYLTYTERYHHEVLHDLTQELRKVWEASVNKAPEPSKEALEHAKLEDARTLSMELSTETEKLSSPRTRQPVETSLSVKIPFVYNMTERHLIMRTLVKKAETVFSDLTKSWKEVFTYEEKGQLKPNFKITGDTDEVRLQLATQLGSHESYKTLYAVRCDYGRGKRDYDRVYLLNLVA